MVFLQVLCICDSLTSFPVNPELLKQMKLTASVPLPTRSDAAEFTSAKSQEKEKKKKKNRKKIRNVSLTIILKRTKPKETDKAVWALEI